MGRLFIILIIALITNKSLAQDTARIKLYKTVLQIKPSVGFNFPIIKIFKGAETDHLLAYDDQTFYWQFLTASWFFSKHVGLEFNYQAASSKNIHKRSEKFYQLMQSEYGNNYFVKVPDKKYGPTDDFDILTGYVEKFFLGVLYRKEFHRFFIYPKIAVGLTSFDTEWKVFYLKGKNSHNVLEISYSPENDRRDYFTINGSITFGYKLAKRIFVSADLSTSYCKTNIAFRKTTRDMLSDQRTEEREVYRKNSFNISLGAGLIFVINNGHR